MSLEFILKNSPVSGDIPFPTQLVEGEIALNYHSDGCFLTCVDTQGKVRRLNEVWVNKTPPNSPELGLLWCDINGTSPLLKIWLGAAVQWFTVGSGVGPGPGPGGGVQSITVVPNGGVSLGGTASNPILSVDSTVVRTSGDQNISGTKTFNSPIRADLRGNADTATTASNLNQSVLAGAGLTGGGQLNRSVTLSVLPATSSTIGGVKVGAGISVAKDGTISASFSPGTTFLGERNVVSQSPDPNPPNGGYYINSADGLAGAAWIGIAGAQVRRNDQIIWSSKDNKWANGGSATTGVEQIKAGDGITVADPISPEPTVSVDSSVVRTGRKIAVGEGLSGGGTLQSDVAINLRKATTDALGGIIVGTGLSINDGILSADTTGPVLFKGLTQVDTDSPENGPQAGWTYINQQQAIANESWAGLFGKEVPAQTYIAFNGTVWQIGSRIETIGIDEIIAGTGITVLDGKSSAPTVQVNDQVVLITGTSVVTGQKTFTQPIVADITGKASFADNAAAAVISDSCKKKVNAGDGLSGGGPLTQDLVIQCDETVVRTLGPQDIDGKKSFKQPIQGNLNGNADTATNAIFSENAVLAQTLDKSVIPGDGMTGGGKLLQDINIAVDDTVIRTFGTQRIGGKKSFDLPIEGNLNGNADTATNAQFAQQSVITKTVDLTVFAGSGLQGGGKLLQDINIAVDNTVVRTFDPQTIDGKKTFVQSIEGNLNGNADTATNAQFAQQSVISKTVDLTVSAGDGLQGGGKLDRNLQFSVNESVVRTINNQEIDGNKKFLKAIQGNLNGNADTATNAIFSENAVLAQTLDKSVVAGDGMTGGGKLLTDVTVSVDGTVIRNFGNQDIDGNKKFLKAIQGNLNGNADTATNAQFAQESVISKTLDLSVLPGDGLQGGGKLVQNINIAVDDTVIRNFGNQDIDGNKKFLKAIQGNLNGNADSATNAQFAQQSVVSKTVDLTVSAGDGLQGGGKLDRNLQFSVNESVVRTINDQTIDGNKKFLKAIQGNLNGNADSATNAQFAANLNRRVNAVEGLTGGGLLNQDINIGLPNSGVSAGFYTAANIQVDRFGRITSASSSSIPPPFESGTRILFYQSSAPSGWSRVTDGRLDNAGIRVVTGNGGGSGGSIPFSTLFSSNTSYAGAINITSGEVGYTALVESVIPGHSHGYTNNPPRRGTSGGGGRDGADNNGTRTDNYGGSGGHTHGLSGVNATGNFTANFDLRYVDMIVCQKN